MMMKKLKFWGLILVSAMCVGLTSCGGDDGESVQDPFDDTVTDPNAIISFKDPLVAALCIQNFDRNNDSKLSYAEAAAVIDLGKVFGDTSDDVDEVTCPRFLFVCIQTIMIT